MLIRYFFAFLPITIKEIVSVAAIIAIIAVFVSSGTLVNPLLAKSRTEKASTGTAETDYKDFKRAMLRARGQKAMQQNNKLSSAMAKFMDHPQVQDQVAKALFPKVEMTAIRNKG